MANSILSPNMSLPIPVIGTDPGPDWASNLNASLSALDGHNHASGSGVQITPSGLNINSDLNFLSNNALALRSARFTTQAAALALPTDLSCVYVSNGNLYYNNAAGLQIQLTNSSGIAGTSGSIANLVSPASVTFVSASGTYQFQSNSATAGNLDGASIVLRTQNSGSPGVTLSPPSSLSSNYSLVLPAVPTQKSLMTLDTSGNMGTIAADNTTISYSSGALSVVAGGIGATQLAALSVATSNIQAGAVTATQEEILPYVQFSPVTQTYTGNGVIAPSSSFTQGTFTGGRGFFLACTGTVNFFSGTSTSGYSLAGPMGITLTFRTPGANLLFSTTIAADFTGIIGLLNAVGGAGTVPPNNQLGALPAEGFNTIAFTPAPYTPGTIGTISVSGITANTQVKLQNFQITIFQV